LGFEVGIAANKTVLRDPPQSSLHERPVPPQPWEGDSTSRVDCIDGAFLWGVCPSLLQILKTILCNRILSKHFKQSNVPSPQRVTFTNAFGTYVCAPTVALMALTCESQQLSPSDGAFFWRPASGADEEDQSCNRSALVHQRGSRVSFPRLLRPELHRTKRTLPPWRQPSPPHQTLFCFVFFQSLHHLHCFLCHLFLPVRPCSDNM